MIKSVKYLVLLLLFVLLISIRFFENSLFYDPLIHYFKTDFLNQKLPKINTAKLIFSYLIRFSLNSILSLLILVLLFSKNRILAFSKHFFSFSFIFLISLFLINYYIFENNTQLLFYIRRFIIQPLFLLLLIPAFYYQKLHENA